MIKKTILLTNLLFSLFTTTLFANEEYTTWKCAVYPKSNSPHAKNYAIIQFNGKKAIKYVYFKSPISPKFSLLKMHYTYLGNSKSNPSVAIYLYAEHDSILAIDPVRHIASDAAALLQMMPDDINATDYKLFGKKLKLTSMQKTGANGHGYYCNINQQIKMPDSEGVITDDYDEV